MARPQSLVPGAIFFLVHYYDDELLVPDIQTLEYRSQDVDDDGKHIWLFCEPGGSQESSSGEVTLIGFHESQLYELLSIDELLSAVTELRHVIHGKAATSEATEPRLVLDRAVLAERVSSFLSSNSRSLQIGVRFTDDGILVQRHAGKSELLLFMHPLREPEKNSRLDQLIRARNLQTREDYLADKGRTRIISMVISEDQAGIVDLCAALLSDVLAICPGDQLAFAVSD